MANVYTKTGDKGTTGLYTGERINKASLRVEAYGTVDEVQAFLGLARAHGTNESVKEALLQVEKELWMLMADIASLHKEPTITDEYVVGLEKIIDAFDEQLSPLSAFILPGESQSSSYLHVARTIVRRAERDLWALFGEEGAHESNLKYLNRLSDLCFILARVEEEL